MKGCDLDQAQDAYPQEPDDFVFAHNAARFSESLTSDPSSIPGLDKFQGKLHLALDLLTGEVVDGDNDYEPPEERLAKRFGDDYSLRYEMVELMEPTSSAA